MKIKSDITIVCIKAKISVWGYFVTLTAVTRCGLLDAVKLLVKGVDCSQ